MTKRIPSCFQGKRHSWVLERRRDHEFMYEKKCRRCKRWYSEVET